MVMDADEWTDVVGRWRPLVDLFIRLQHTSTCLFGATVKSSTDGGKKRLPDNTSAQLRRAPNTHAYKRTLTHTGCFHPTWFTVFEAVRPAMN